MCCLMQFWSLISVYASRTGYCLHTFTASNSCLVLFRLYLFTCPHTFSHILNYCFRNFVSLFTSHLRGVYHHHLGLCRLSPLHLAQHLDLHHHRHTGITLQFNTSRYFASRHCRVAEKETCAARTSRVKHTSEWAQFLKQHLQWSRVTVKASIIQELRTSANMVSSHCYKNTKLLQNSPIGQRGVGGDIQHVEQCIPGRALSCCKRFPFVRKKKSVAQENISDKRWMSASKVLVDYTICFKKVI